MPVQKFAPMAKNFPIFDCDAHVTEPPWLWERAKDWLTKDELEALKNTIWFDPESDQLIVNGKAGSGTAKTGSVVVALNQLDVHRIHHITGEFDRRTGDKARRWIKRQIKLNHSKRVGVRHRPGKRRRGTIGDGASQVLIH